MNGIIAFREHKIIVVVIIVTTCLCPDARLENRPRLFFSCPVNATHLAPMDMWERRWRWRDIFHLLASFITSFTAPAGSATWVRSSARGAVSNRPKQAK